MAQSLLHDLRVDPQAQKVCRVAVAQVVEANSREACASQYPREIPPRDTHTSHRVPMKPQNMRVMGPPGTRAYRPWAHMKR